MFEPFQITFVRSDDRPSDAPSSLPTGDGRHGVLLMRLTAKGRAGCLARPLPLALSYNDPLDPPRRPAPPRSAGRVRSWPSRVGRVVLFGGAALPRGRGRRARTTVPDLLWSTPFAAAAAGDRRAAAGAGGPPLVGAEQVQAGGRPGAGGRGPGPLRRRGATATTARRPGWPTVLAVLEHAILRDFVPFIVLLASLYVISGGLQLKGDLRARPAVNTGDPRGRGGRWPA